MASTTEERARARSRFSEAKALLIQLTNNPHLFETPGIKPAEVVLMEASLAYAYQELHEWQEAILKYHDVMDLCNEHNVPVHGEWLQRLSACHAHRGELREAVSALQKALRVCADGQGMPTSVHEELCLLFVKLHDLSAALMYIKQVPKTTKISEAVNTLLGMSKSVPDWKAAIPRVCNCLNEVNRLEMRAALYSLLLDSCLRSDTCSGAAVMTVVNYFVACLSIMPASKQQVPDVFNQGWEKVKLLAPQHKAHYCYDWGCNLRSYQAVQKLREALRYARECGSAELDSCISRALVLEQNGNGTDPNISADELSVPQVPVTGAENSRRSRLVALCAKKEEAEARKRSSFVDISSAAGRQRPVGITQANGKLLPCFVAEGFIDNDLDDDGDIQDLEDTPVPASLFDCVTQEKAFPAATISVVSPVLESSSPRRGRAKRPAEMAPREVIPISDDSDGDDPPAPNVEIVISGITVEQMRERLVALRNGGAVSLKVQQRIGGGNAESCLMDTLRLLPALQVLDLCKCGLSSAVLSAVKCLPQLSVLKVSYNPIGLTATKEQLCCLFSESTVQVLDLSWTHLTNKTGWLTSCRATAKLAVLDLSENLRLCGGDPESARALLRLVGTAENLTTLNISNVGMRTADAGVPFPALPSSLTSLSMGGPINALVPRASPVADVPLLLVLPVGLTKLDLSNARLGELLQLAQLLEFVPHLTSLNIAGCGVTEEALSQIATALTQRPLRFLDVRGNSCSPRLLGLLKANVTGELQPPTVEPSSAKRKCV
eukprot:TRINITY_DN6561_c0_g1_i1.p1 TRINITY_DN6561_c0_g1~~TRINITY_DN6561_c0_g1_i1.p1  ORF type:complete len:885 (+),score=149.98 TRINITY_DN6561_c0_g1_i1:325-2655(+)